MNRPAIALVGLSNAFSDLWPELANGLGAQVREVAPDAPVPAAPDIAAVLVAAGGAEPEARHWLDRWRGAVGPPVFVVGADPGRRCAVQTVSRGAEDYFCLPQDLEILRNAVATALTRFDGAFRSAESELSGAQAAAFEGIVGGSPALREVLARAGRILGHAQATALITGETGTGKELLARAIHEGGRRRSAPFVPVNCSALPATLFESELFGHERGAFTNAHAAKPGLFEVADGGTLFLDEVGTVPLDLQAKLLRVLEEREVRRVGGIRSRKVDVRIIAATNENLGKSVKDGTFRDDLYYRLGVIVLRVPALRERDRDVLLIARHYLQGLAEQYQVPVPRLDERAVRALLSHDWPGNVRELKNAVERALLLSRPGELDAAELTGGAAPTPERAGGAIPFPASLERITSSAARATVEMCEGNRSEAARRLGISRQRLRRLLDLGGSPPGRD